MLGPWIWGTFLLRSIYSGLLYYIFSNDIHHKLPLNLGDATNQNYISVLNRFTFYDVANIPFYHDRSRHNLQPIILNSSDELAAIKYVEENLSRNLYAVISKEFLMHYAQESGKVALFYVIPETVMKQQITIYFTKHTILAYRFEKMIMDLKSSGLQRYYIKRYFDSKTMMNSYKEGDKMIEQKDLLGIYVICGALQLLAVLTFLLELLSQKISKLRVLFD